MAVGNTIKDNCNAAQPGLMCVCVHEEVTAPDTTAVNIGVNFATAGAARYGYISEILVISGASGSGQTVTIKRNGTTVSSAMTLGATGVIARSTSIVQAQKTLSPGDQLTAVIDANSAAFTVVIFIAVPQTV